LWEVTTHFSTESGTHPLFTFIESYYKQTRLHSFNDYRPPNEAEADLRNGAQAA